VEWKQTINDDDQRPRTFALGIWLREIITIIVLRAEINLSVNARISVIPQHVMHDEKERRKS
jgi:hypothetical protein